MYMLHQRTTTAVREGYRGTDLVVIEEQLARARQARAWLEGLTIEPDARAWLVEPVAAVEEALAELVRKRSTTS
jgi:hypothetical protein